MNPTIKARIESIRRGEVPEGYKLTKGGIMPLAWCKRIYQAKDLFFSVSDKKHSGALEVLSVTQDRGIIPRRLVDIDIKYDDANLGSYKKVLKGDFVISLRSFQGGIECSNYTGIVSPAYTVVRSKQKIVDEYYKAYFKTGNFINRLNIGTYGIRDGKQVSFNDFGDMVLHYPPIDEQQKIAEILSAQDRVIELKEKLLAEKQKQKKYLMQQLLTGKKRLSAFSGEWRKYKFLVVFKVLSSKQHQINRVQYLSEGNYPVVDQGKEYIAGYYNDEKKVLKCPNEGIIVFGDHTREIKYINFDFIVGADGTQLLMSSDNSTSTYFLYYILLNMRIPNDGYSRHLKYLKEAFYLIPPFSEQAAIVKILSTADKEIELLKKDIEQEKLKKKSLMQLLLTGIVRVSA